MSFAAVFSFFKIYFCLFSSIFTLFIPYRTNEGDHHFEHMENVRLYHQSIQEQTAPPSGSSIFGDANPSSSFLISTLRYHSSLRRSNIIVLLLCFLSQFFFNRKKLSELDNIQRYFSRKLSPPTIPSWSEQDFSASKHENQRETDACQLLIKSKQLVGEVNSIITGELFLIISSAIIFSR